MISREKARIPAWTDRILRRGTNLRQINYNCAPLRFSDHRPVYATFECTVSIVDEAIRESLSRDIYERRRSSVGTTIASTIKDDTDDEDLVGYDPIEPGLPPASSDRRKWWLDNGQPARSSIKPPQNGFVPNPNRPSNPYTPTDEPDWVTVPRMSQNKSVAPPPPNPRPSTSSSTNGTRKLPPPFDPKGTSISALKKNFSQTSVDDTTTPIKIQTMTDRRMSTSTTSSSSKKAPPPVARKPVHLTSLPSSKSTPTLSTAPTIASCPTTQSTQDPRPTAVDHTGFAPPPRRVTGVGATYGTKDVEDRREISTPPPPPQPRRPGGAKKVTNGNGIDEEGPRPSLPPRRPTADLLSGDDEMGMSGWEPLKPT